MPAERVDDPLPPTWTALENRLYRRDKIYTNPSWPLTADHLSRAIVVAAPCAGPIAVIADGGWGRALEVYTLSGQLLRRFERLREKTVPPFRVVAAGWSVGDLLSIVYNDGAVIRVNAGLQIDHGRSIKVFGSSKDERIYDAVVLNSGEVVLRGASGAVYRLSEDDKVVQDVMMVKPPDGVVREVLNGGIGAVCGLGGVEMLFVTEMGNVALVNEGGVFPMGGERDVAQICVSGNGMYVAAMESRGGVLFVCTVDLQTRIASVNLGEELGRRGVENVLSDVIFDASRPEGIAWVGSDAVAVLYREHLVLVGPHGGVAVWDVKEEGVVMVSEDDGLRLISAKGVEFVQLVAEPVQTVLCRKQSVGHKLLKCSGGIVDGMGVDALKRYRLLRELRESGSLLEASRSCTAAAYLEVQVEQQQKLLHAAAYGQKHASVFAESGNENVARHSNDAQTSTVQKRKDERSRRDVNMVPTAIAILRVLHAAGAADAGVPLTKPQLDILGLAALVARLSRYGKHTLAIRLAFFGGISPYDVLSEWAAEAVRANIDENDQVITSLISERFETVGRSHSGVEMHGSHRGRALPYVKAAEAAYAMGRHKCAELLLRREIRPAPKVAMYLRMGREGPAVIAAVASGDPELVLDALGTILETKSVRETAKLLRTLPSASGNRAADLFACHLKQIGDYNSLRIVYMEIGRRREAALVEVFLADQTEDPREHMAALEKAAVAISRGYSRRACHFEMRAVQHAAAVAANAIELEKKARLIEGDLRKANDGDLLARAVVDINDDGRRRDTLVKLKKELRIPDRRYFWICLDAMAETGHFQAIESLSYSMGHGKAPPIGLTAFVDTCLKYKMEDEAVKYALRIADLRDRARALARCGRGREAADIASKLRNQQLLEEVQDLAARHVANMKIPLTRLPSTKS